MSDKYYLRENVYIDPLINNWYAWPNLLSPLPYSLYMSKTHIRLMKSFIDNYELHILANQDKTIAGGGEFINCTAEQVEEVAALLKKFETEDAIYGKLAQAIKDLNALLKAHVSGESLDPLYEQVPDLLKGYVELVMDTNHNASFRIIEGLVYNSHYYNTQLQSVSLGILDGNSARPFVLSTPRFPENNNLHIQEPFASQFWDDLFRCREYPITKAEIDALFASKLCQGGLSPYELFTTEVPTKTNVQKNQVAVTYIGHAGLLITTGETTILVDPVIANITDENRNEALGFEHLPEKIDYICLTHNHADHVNIESLLQLRYKTDTIVVPKNNGGSLVDPSLKLMFSQLNFNVREIDDMEQIPVQGGKIVGIPFLGEHGDLNIRSKTGWYFELLGKKIYAGADSSNLEPRVFEQVNALFGDLDLMAIGMECVGAPFTWLYGALFTEKVAINIKESRRLDGCDFEKGIQIAEILKPQNIWIYALGLEEWYNYFMGLDYSDDSKQLIESGKMVEYFNSRGVPVERLCGKQHIILS
ncbi:MBL fold metallo-hydrolase [Pseudoalteromonas luteoviolacea]|uniref:MBL fold metallo-hydrolase n=1 Tax=Pseudoalteromonas luteoviolacea TaxID=43657 RepID=UPI001B3A2EDD|nr:MBL fold metallo-hydrolase [Pseudoalteromonas luteoviolacea]MBQ4880379.1 MBL fold metallo-hydrolase [Pseudoalteromonas luteoviolacea]MBQ4909440.1 MBL fold metallo-hydrolase [Pseudoalteromonas luteoviolacea]